METTSSLVQEIEGVIGGSRYLPIDIEKKMTDEGLSKESFILLSESDLKELGFAMGPRKLLLQWFGQADTVRADTLSTGQSSSSTPESSEWHTNLSVSRKPFKGCQAVDILSQYRKGAIDGCELSSRLTSGGSYSRQDRMLVVKVMGRHLMQYSKVQDRPHKDEKMAMAKCIMDTFPIFRDEVFYDPVAHIGHLEAYIRCRRSRNPFINTLWTHSRNAGYSQEVEMEVPVPDEEAERILRECRPNVSNKVQLLQGMRDTRATRRAWIKEKTPTITDICRRYPRLQDMEEAVREEFLEVTSVDTSLTREFQLLKDKVLTVAAASPSTRDLLNQITNDYDEDKKSEVAVHCLLVMVRPPPKRGIKKPLPSPYELLRALYRTFHDETVDGALETMTTDGIKQPALLKLNDAFYVKLDNMAFHVESASCFSEALEFLFMCFWVFNVSYPEELRLFYCFIEKLLGMNQAATKVKSRLLADVWRILH